MQVYDSALDKLDTEQVVVRDAEVPLTTKQIELTASLQYK